MLQRHTWLTFLGQAFGWGAYLFPIGLIIVGLWLVLRSFQQHSPRGNRADHWRDIVIPEYPGLAAFLLFPRMRTPWLLRVTVGVIQGRSFTTSFLPILGLAGVAIALFAWLIIALILILDISVVDLFRWAPAAGHPHPGWNSRIGWMSAKYRRGKPAPSKTTINAPAPPANWSDLDTLPEVANNGSIPFSTLDINQPRPWALPAIDQILEKGNETIFDDDVDRQRARVIEETFTGTGCAGQCG